MIIKAYNESHQYLLFVDIEFNNRELIQFAGLLFQWIDDETYQLTKSFNQYVTAKVGYPFMEYTGIKNDFLSENGIPLRDLVAGVQEDLLADIDLSDLLVIGHGLKNDRLVLLDNGINLSTFNDKPIDGYCTFNNGRRILHRDNNLKLTNVAEEAGYYMQNAHNAYEDVWAEVAVFTYLKKLEEQSKGDETNVSSELREDADR